MKMINLIKEFAFVAALALTGACTANYINVNRDPYGIDREELSRDGYSVRAALTGIANGVISPDENTTQFTECLLGGEMGGYMAMGNPGFSSTIALYNAPNEWTRVFMRSAWIIPVIYSNYNLLHQVSDDPVIYAVSDIVKVAAMHRITDTYGPIPYSKIGANGQINVPYDSQEDVYKKMIEELTVAVEALTPNRTNNFMSAADVIYGGNVEKWIRLGNSLKLRLAMRMSYADPEFSRKAAEEVARHEVGCLETNADNPYFGVFGPNGNPINVAVEYNMLTEHEDGSACVTEGGDSHAAADIIAYMNGYNDPRRAAYFTPSEFDGVDFCGIRRGIIPPNHTELGHKYSGVKIAKNDPLCWMNAAEVAFLKAEAVAVFGYDMGGSAQGFYEEGIRLSFAQWGAGDATEYLADNTSCPAEYVDPVNAEYGSPALSNVTIAWNEAADVEVKQEKIITQKWIANWLLGNEAWADYRRTGYPKLMPVLDNRSNGIVDSNLGARRMPYPTEEITGNTENYQNAVNRLLNGRDNMATRLWFDCKNK